MQNLLLDYKKILITFSWITLIMLVGAESIGIVVELGFTHLQHILVIWSIYVQLVLLTTVSSSVNVST